MTIVVIIGGGTAVYRLALLSLVPPILRALIRGLVEIQVLQHGQTETEDDSLQVWAMEELEVFEVVFRSSLRCVVQLAAH